jgi:hypothetical protein
MHHIAVQRRCVPIVGARRDLSRWLAVLIERFDRPAQRGALAVIDLAQTEQMPLQRAAAGYPAVLDGAPVVVLPAVFPANLVALMHGCGLSNPAAVSQETWSTPHTVFAVSRAPMPGFSATYRSPSGHKFPHFVVELRKSGHVYQPRCCRSSLHWRCLDRHGTSRQREHTAVQPCDLSHYLGTTQWCTKGRLPTCFHWRACRKYQNTLSNRTIWPRR